MIPMSSREVPEKGNHQVALKMNWLGKINALHPGVVVAIQRSQKDNASLTNQGGVALC